MGHFIDGVQIQHAGRSLDIAPLCFHRILEDTKFVIHLNEIEFRIELN